MTCDHEHTTPLTYQYDHCLMCGEVICNGKLEEEDDNNGS